MLPVIFIFALASIPLASAQEGSDNIQAPEPAIDVAPAAAAPAATPTPSVEVAATATAAAPIPFQPRANYVPTLPPSKPCTAGDMIGLWRLKQVYENPPDAATRDFSASPYQYLYFSNDSTYSAYKSGSAIAEATVLTQLSTPQQVLQQFLVQEGGFIFVYRDGIAIDTQACFIVANQKEPFEIGQMLLMPPQGQSAIRIVKVYAKVGGGTNAAASQSGSRNVRQPSRSRQPQSRRRPMGDQQTRQTERLMQREERRQQRLMQRQQSESQKSQQSPQDQQ